MITTESTFDEFGQERWFVDRDGDWIAGPFDTQDEAIHAAYELTPWRRTNPSFDVCVNCGHQRQNHLFTRRGILCVNNRTTFKVDRDAVLAERNEPSWPYGGPDKVEGF